MKKQLMAVLIASSVVALTACNDETEQNAEPTAQVASSSASGSADLGTEIQQVSYGIGLNFSQNIKRQGVDLDMTAFNAGVSDGLAGNEPQLAQEDIMKAMQSFQKSMAAKQKEDRDVQGGENKKQGEAFFVENTKKEGVITLESGLQYKIITEGKGEIPSADSTVEVNYRGTLLSGEEFDSSYKRGQPVSFPVKGVIKGWTEALQLMPVGSKWELYIPADLAYGPGGTGPIGPNSALIFEVELLSIKAAEEKKEEEKKDS